MYRPQPFDETKNIIMALECLERMGCCTFLKPSPCSHLVQDVSKLHIIKHFDIPRLES